MSDIDIPRGLLADLIEDPTSLRPLGGVRFSPDGDSWGPTIGWDLVCEQARRTADVLADYTTPGDRVLLTAPNSLQFITQLLGSQFAGTIAVPVPPAGAANAAWHRRVQLVVHDSEPSVALGDPATLSEGLPPGSQIPILAESDLSTGDSGRQRRAFNGGALLQYTSGSTSEPRGVRVTEDCLFANLAAIKSKLDLEASLRAVTWLPLFHDMGLISAVYLPLYLGGLSYFMEPRHFVERPFRWLRAISQHGATFSAAPTFGYRLGLRRISDSEAETLDLSKWDLAMCGAEQVDPQVMTDWGARFSRQGFRASALTPCYGLAESTAMVSSMARGAGLLMHRPSSIQRPSPEVVCVGAPASGHSVAIVDPLSREKCCEEDEGEIWVAGPSVAPGYWGRENDTRETFRAFTSDGDGPYLRTGDAGFTFHGQLYVSGRYKEVIVVRGRQIWPQDVERVVQAVNSNLREGRGVAFGAPNPERLMVVQEVADAVSEAELEHLRREIATAIVREIGVRPHTIELVPGGTLPMTTSGKLKRVFVSRQNYGATDRSDRGNG